MIVNDEKWAGCMESIRCLLFEGKCLIYGASRDIAILLLEG
jgi:hypothetical protein